MSDLPEPLEVLSSRVEALEQRVLALEHRVAPRQTQNTQHPTPPELQPIADLPEIPEAGSLFPVLGRAMLGFAGAYALRAAAASTPILRLLVALIAIAYAFAWLVIAARSRTAPAYARIIYSLTAAVILMPMLGELTLRFGVLTPPATALVLVAFPCAAILLGWKNEAESVLWVAQAAAAIAALALSIATRELVPFAYALLAQLALSELAGMRERGRAVRPVVMLAAGLAIATMIFVYQGPQSARENYPALAPAALIAPSCLLFLIQAASIVTRTALLRRSVTILEVFQSILSYGLAALAVLWFSHNFGEPALGIATLILSAGCYALAFTSFRRATPSRNFNVFGAWAAALYVAGILWSLPVNWAVLCLAGAALIAAMISRLQDCFALAVHGGLFLLGSVIASGLPHYVIGSLIGSTLPSTTGRALVVSGCILAVYVLIRENTADAWHRQFLHLLMALVSAGATAALLTHAELMVAAQFVTPDLVHLAFLRTLAVCAVGFGLAFAGRRWRRVQLSRVAYVTLAFEAAKLMFEDLRCGQMAFIAGSFLVFALALIGIPSVAKQRRKVSPA